jgi:hypothetical protein
LTYYTATKNSFTLLEIIIGQEKIHDRSVHLLYLPDVIVNIAIVCWSANFRAG